MLIIEHDMDFVRSIANKVTVMQHQGKYWSKVPWTRCRMTRVSRKSSWAIEPTAPWVKVPLPSEESRMFEVDRLCVSYAQSQVVNEVSFAAAQNEAVALMGRNGIQPSIIKDIANALNEIRKLRQITLIVSEQVLSFALAVADRILVLERGRIIHEDRRADAGVARITG